MLGFIHIEKCGGTTLIDSLRRTFFLDHCDVIPRRADSMTFDPDDLRHLLRLRPKLRSISGHSVSVNAGLQDVCSFAFFTLLRDPLKRYISDYQHLGRQFLLGRGATFEDWLAIESRRNFQTRAIAGDLNVQSAMQLLSDRVELTGVLEQYDDFVFALQHLSHRVAGRAISSAQRIRNNRSRSADVRDERNQIERRFGRQLREANVLDLDLYEFVHKVLLPKQRRQASTTRFLLASAAADKHTRLAGRARTLTQWLYRNVVYKPYVGRLPFKPHALPIYGRSRRARPVAPKGHAA